MLPSDSSSPPEGEVPRGSSSCTRSHRVARSGTSAVAATNAPRAELAEPGEYEAGAEFDPIGECGQRSQHERTRQVRVVPPWCSLTENESKPASSATLASALVSRYPASPAVDPWPV